MPGFEVGTILGGIVEGLSKFSESVQVIGEPIQAGEKLIIPAVVARVGFGAGGGSGSKPSEGEEKAEEGGGGGGGGALQLTPVFLIVDEQGERLLTVPSTVDSAAAVVDKIKGTVERIFSPRGEKPAEEEE